MATTALVFPSLDLGSRLCVVYRGNLHDKVEEEEGEYHGSVASVDWTSGSVREIIFVDGKTLSYVGVRDDFPSGYMLGSGAKVIKVVKL